MQPLARPNNPPPPLAATPKRMTLAAVTRGRVKRPKRVLVYGTEGVGKSTFAAGADAPIFLGAEDGTSELDVARLPEPKSWQDILDGIEVLRAEPHEYRTLAIDSLDWAEPLCWEHVCKAAKVQAIEDFGYGKGYVAALDAWRVFVAALDRLRAERGLDIVLIAHAHVRPFKDPASEGYDRWELKLHSKAAGLLKEWSDAVLFAKDEEFVAKDKSGRTRGVGEGVRIIHTQRRPAWDAKNRYGLPEQLPLSWSEFQAAIEAGTPAEPAKIRALVEELLPKLTGDDTKKAADALARAGSDGTKLAQLLDWARGRVMVTEEQPKEEAQQ